MPVLPMLQPTACGTLPTTSRVLIPMATSAPAPSARLHAAPTPTATTTLGVEGAGAALTAPVRAAAAHLLRPPPAPPLHPFPRLRPRPCHRHAPHQSPPQGQHPQVSWISGTLAIECPASCIKGHAGNTFRKAVCAVLSCNHTSTPVHSQPGARARRYRHWPCLFLTNGALAHTSAA